ncbi:MAG: response regulator [Actinomadura sp.]
MDDKAKILLVDDREENLIALEAILSSLDQELIRATSGEEALKALLTGEFAVILLDIVMPSMDGFETARDIKHRKKTRDIPIIFLTAVNSDPDYAFRGYAAGAVDFIAKPFDPWVLRAKVSVFVDLHNKNRQLREQAALLREQAVLLRTKLTDTPDLTDTPGLTGAYGYTDPHGLTDAHQNGVGPAPGAGDSLTEASRQLTAVEAQVAVLTEHMPPGLEDVVDELGGRVAELRAALDALRSDPDGTAG